MPIFRRLDDLMFAHAAYPLARRFASVTPQALALRSLAVVIWAMVVLLARLLFLDMASFAEIEMRLLGIGVACAFYVHGAHREENAGAEAARAAAARRRAPWRLAVRLGYLGVALLACAAFVAGAPVAGLPAQAAGTIEDLGLLAFAYLNACEAIPTGEDAPCLHYGGSALAACV